jgi:ferredoxin
LVDEKAATIEARADACILCGQCVAVCPTESLTMPQMPMEDFERLPEQPFEYGEFFDFLKLRRSVRVFKDEPVEREVTQKILDAAATAPMGFPPHTTEVVVIDSREELNFLLEQFVKDYEVGDLIPLTKSANVRVTELEASTSMVHLFEVPGTWSNSTWV